MKYIVFEIGTEAVGPTVICRGEGFFLGDALELAGSFILSSAYIRVDTCANYIIIGLKLYTSKISTH